MDEAKRVARALSSRLPPAIAPLFGPSFVHSSRLYDEFVYGLTLGVFRDTGLHTVSGTAGTAEEIVGRAGLDPVRARVPVDWMLRYLATRHALEAEGGESERRFRRRDPLPDVDLAPVQEEAQRHDPSWLPSYVLAQAAARDYPAFLRGQTTGEEILFSPARLRLWFDYFSNDNGLYVVNNQVGAIAVSRWMPPGGGVILELGAGLGSAATATIECLTAAGRLGEVREYRFTELVAPFLQRGQRVMESRFPGMSALTFSSLDMNRPFGEQGIAAGSVAVVYAVNALHVASDLGFTLTEAFRALEPGGWLIVSECVRPMPGQALYAEFVFNLMETFRSPRLHADYRPNGGFLTPEQWSQALRACGFTSVRFLPDVASLRSEFPEFSVAAIGAARPPLVP